MSSQDGWPAQPPRTYQSQRAYAMPHRRHRRWPLVTAIVVIVILALLVVADRVAAKITENRIAAQAQKSFSLSAQPDVNIEGFPFLTQVAAHDLRTVTITGSNVSSGALEFSSIDVTASQTHINSSFNGVTVDSLKGDVVLSFGELSSLGRIPAGVRLSDDGSDGIKATGSFGPFRASAVAQVTRSAANKFTVHVVNADGIPVSALGWLNFSVTVPALPDGVQVQGASVTPGGVRVNFSGQDIGLGQ